MKQKIAFLICILITHYGCNAPKSEIPESLIGNYYDKSGENFWAYSFQKKFIICDNEFWDVTKVVNSKELTKIFIENENSKKRLLITPISNDDFKIDHNKSSKTYSTIRNQDIRKPKNSSYSLHPGKTCIYGFIKNSTKYVDSNPRIQFSYHDYITIQTNSVYAPIDSLGRFQLEMELLSAQEIIFVLGNKIYPVFVSPNDTLMMFLDPEHPEKFDFQGKNSDINYDLLMTRKRIYQFGSQDKMQLPKHFNEFKAYKDSIRNSEMHFLKEYSKNNYCSELFKIWFETTSKVIYFTDLLKYSWANNHSQDIESNREAYDSFLDTFFENINGVDSVAQITGRYFFFTNAVNNRILRDRKSFLTVINNVLPVDERKEKFHEVYIAKKAAIINTLPEGKLKDILLANLVSMEIKNRNIDHIDKTYDVVDELIHYKPYLTHLSNFIADFKRKEAEFENKPITFRKASGSGEHLLKKITEDNLDKVLILDFWFTGCGACRRDFESVGPFKKDLSLEADVEFIYLCYSSTEENWKYVSKEYNLQGQNYLLTQEQFMYFQDLFSISSAPRYILINKTGRIVNSNFRLPLNKNQFIMEIKNAI